MVLALLRDERGGSSVEFAMVFVALMLFSIGIIDFARASFDWNAVEKSTQIGARQTVIRDPVAIPIKTWFECNPPSDTSMVGLLCADPAGGIRPECDFGTVVCTSTGCTRNGTAMNSTKLDPAVFSGIVTAMQGALPRLQPANVTLTYKSSTLGFIGKPDGPVPEVTAQVNGLPFDLLGLDIFAGLIPIFGGNWTVPTLSVTLTGEDISDNTCAEQGLAETTVNGRLVCQGNGNGGGNGNNPVCF
jgi:hypothetical protein